MTSRSATRGPLGRAGALHLALLSLAASAAHAGSKDYAVATVAIAADGQSAQAAVRVGHIAKETFAQQPDASLLDLEKVLEGAEPLWKDKLAAAEAAARKGKTAMDSVELPVAADAFAEAMVAYEQAVPGLKDINAVRDTLVQQGTVLVLQGDTRSGKEAFFRALTLDPGYRMEEEGTNKRVLSTFDAAVKTQRKAGQGTLTVYASSGAAEVWIDGVFRGVAPFTADVSAGRHYVRVVRDGYLSWGTAAEVKRGSEVSVQASLRPTARLPKLEELSARVTREQESDKPIAELAAALKVDRLVAIVVKDQNGSASLIATMVDGVSAKVIARANKVFATGDTFFDHDVHNFLVDKIIHGEGAAPEEYVPVKPKKPDDKTSMLPGEAEKVETPGAVIGGWVLTGSGAALAVNSVVFGIISYTLFDDYRNKLKTQLDPNLEPVRSAWLTTSIVTDASWILGAAAIAGGTVALVNGYSEQAAQEEVLNP